MVMRPSTAPGVPSSLRLRRFVIAGRVLIDVVEAAHLWMTPKEIAAVTGLISRARHMLEFGVGGSTTLALRLGVARLTSVDSDPAWIERLRADPGVASALSDGRLQLLYADIGPVGLRGGPLRAELKERWPIYAERPWPHVDVRKLDLLLVDGRFRAACVLQAALHVTPKTIIAVHDFWDRPEYHSVLPLLDEVSRCESLGIFRVKRSVDKAEVGRLLAEAAYQPL